jgi:N-methylhydantoinase B/oxoprolinase/acetone carboxylase alpha subunit
MPDYYCLNCGQLQTDVLTCCSKDGEEAMTPQQMVGHIKQLVAAHERSMTEIRSLLARYDALRINDGEKAPGWLLHELRRISIT